MLRYVNCGIVFQEIPDEVTLSINISNCPCHCPGCHSSYLWDDTGEKFNKDTIDAFMKRYGEDITCVCMMGGDSDPTEVQTLADYIHSAYPLIKAGWYSGKQNIPQHIDKKSFDYIKLGPYIEHLGGLKEKILAAKNAGIVTVCVPKKNEKDIAEISPEIKKGLEIVYVEHMQEVLDVALVKQKEENYVH